MPLTQATSKELNIFCDASETAIAAVAYTHLTNSSGHHRLGFILGKAKLAPKHGHTIPRLELCAAVLTTELFNTIHSELDIEFEALKFISDSKGVLGYNFNDTKRFFTHVANRVERIRRCSETKQWNYVPSKLNPAYEATRSLSVKDMQTSMWLNGPTRLLCDVKDDEDDLPLIEPDSEVERFSSWYKLLLCSISILKCFVKSFKTNEPCDPKSPKCLKAAERLIIQAVQKEYYSREMDALTSNRDLPRDSSIRSLDPNMDNDGLIRVGGRLRNSDLTLQEKHPLIIPTKYHIAYLLMQHFHQEVKHQGRLLTEGAIRLGGYWIVGAKRTISQYIRNCVRCLKLRGNQHCPKMGDLPVERLDPAPLLHI